MRDLNHKLETNARPQVGFHVLKRSLKLNRFLLYSDNITFTDRYFGINENAHYCSSTRAHCGVRGRERRFSGIALIPGLQSTERFRSGKKLSSRSQIVSLLLRGRLHAKVLKKRNTRFGGMIEFYPRNRSQLVSIHSVRLRRVG